jgi:CheY-like chemotaxis protein
MQVLICDDDKDLSELLSEQLVKRGYNVLVANSGYKVLELILSQEVDLVITDYWMRDGDGGMVANLCKDKGINCIVATGARLEEIKPYVPSTTTVVDKLHFLDKLSQDTQPLDLLKVS